MESFGKTLVVAGIVLCLLGLLFWFGPAKDRGGLLPGDLFVSREGFRFYFPVVTCLVVSVVLSLLLWLFHH